MKKLLFLLPLTPALFATITCSGGGASWSGSTCSGGTRPYTYTVTGSAGVGTASEIQTAYDDARIGDTIALEAGTVWTVTDPGLIFKKRPSGTGSYLTITSTEAAKLPNSGTRITRAYVPLMATIQTSTANAILSFESSGTPPEHVKLRGIRLRPDPTMSVSSLSYPPLQVGSGVAGGASEDTDGTFYETLLTAQTNIGSAVFTMSSTSWATAGMRVKVSTQFSSNAETFTILNVDSGTQLTMTGNAAVTHPIGHYVRSYLDSYTQQPNDIVVQHCIIDNETYQVPVRRLIALNAQAFSLLDSFVDGAWDYSAADSQAIGGWNGVGPYTITNNWLNSFGENVLFGGVMPAIDITVNAATFKYNYFPHIQEREKYSSATWWGDGRFVFAGYFLRADGTNWFRARNSGFTGSGSAPTWNTTTGATTVDNEVTWVKTTGKPDVKNNFEIKVASHVLLQHNVFQGFWNELFFSNGSQFSMINLKANNQPVCDASVDTYPTCYGGNSIDLQLKNNIFRDLSNDWLNLGAGASAGYPDDYGDILIKDNLVIQDSWATGGQGSYNITIFGSFKPPAATSQKLAWPTGRWFKILNNTLISTSAGASRLFNVDLVSPEVMQGTSYIMGNVFTKGTETGGMGFLTSGNWAFGTGGRSMPEILGCTAPCAGQWEHNVLMGGVKGNTYYPTASFPSGHAGIPLTHCTSNSGCTVDTTLWESSDSTSGLCGGGGCGKLMKDFTAAIAGTRGSAGFTMRNGNSYVKRSVSSDKSDVGADIANLPEIRNLTVTPSDRMVLFQFLVTAPIKDTPCVVEVHTGRDIVNATNYRGATSTVYAGELGAASIGTYYRQDADDADRYTRNGQDRMIIVGHSVNLSASTTYYYRLSCAGDVQTGSFTTLGTLSSTATQTISRKIKHASTASMKVEYGTSYSRATDTITGSSASSNCTSGNFCTVSFSANKGSVYYYRFKEMSSTGGAGSTLTTGRVRTIVVQ